MVEIEARLAENQPYLSAIVSEYFSLRATSALHDGYFALMVPVIEPVIRLVLANIAAFS
jgi:hypothetical protein